MEENSYFSLKLLNGSEIFLKAAAGTETPSIIKKFEEGTFASGFIKLKQVNTERERQPVFFSKQSILSIEQINAGMIGHTNKIWEIPK